MAVVVIDEFGRLREAARMNPWKYFVGWLKVVDSASRTCFVYGCENSCN